MCGEGGGGGVKTGESLKANTVGVIRVCVCVCVRGRSVWVGGVWELALQSSRWARKGGV